MNYKWQFGQLIKVTVEGQAPYYKILGTRMSEWRLNSGIKSYEEKLGMILFYGYSGSMYVITKDGIDQNPFWGSLIDRLREGSADRTPPYTVETITYEQFKKEFV